MLTPDDDQPQKTIKKHKARATLTFLTHRNSKKLLKVSLQDYKNFHPNKASLPFFIFREWIFFFLYSAGE
jgi:hypothetical protein